MREYLVTLLVVSAVTAILGMLPGEEGMRRTVSFALSLAVLAAVVLPLPTLLRDLPADYAGLLDRLETESLEGGDYLREETLSAVGEGVRRQVSEKFGLPEGELSVTAEGDILDGTVLLRRVTLTVGPRAATADLPSIVKYIKKNTGAECEVIYREG